MSYDILPDILNDALVMTLDIGKPVAPRLQSKYPQLTTQQITYSVDLSSKAMKEAFAFIYERHTEINEGAEQKVKADFMQMLKQNYNWLTKKNTAALYNQGCYFAFK